MLAHVFSCLEKSNPTFSADDIVAGIRSGTLRLSSQEASSLISLMPANDVLNGAEIVQWHAYLTDHAISTPMTDAECETFVFTVKLTRLCNLRCTYCNSWAEGPGQVMPFSVLLSTISRAVNTPDAREVEFVWHGGEVTILNPKIALKMIWLQQQLLRPGQIIRNSLQTNAVAISDDWLDMISFLQIGVGVSLDGLTLTDERLDKSGQSSRARALEGISRLRAAGVRFGALSVIKPETLSIDPKTFFEAYIDAGIKGVNLLNVIPSNDIDSIEDHHGFLPIDDFMGYAARLFETWAARYWNEIYVDFFVDLMRPVIEKRRSPTCLWAGDCTGHFLTVEANGTLGPCDKFVGAPSTRFGNVVRDSVEDMIGGSSFVEHWDADSLRAAEDFADCQWTDICHGGCPHDRMLHFKKFGERRSGCCGLSPVLTAIETFDRQQPFIAREILRRWSSSVETSETRDQGGYDDADALEHTSR